MSRLDHNGEELVLRFLEDKGVIEVNQLIKANDDGR